MQFTVSNNELPSDGEYKYFDIPEAKQELLIFRKYGSIQVFSSFCPHFGGPLTLNKEGNLHCSFHDYEFDTNTGACINRALGSKCNKINFFDDGDSIVVEIE